MATGIIDYGVGNLFSLRSSLEYLGESVVLSSDETELKACDRLILPGVGAFGAAMDVLKARGLDKFIIAQAQSGKPLLGICLGMQLLFERSYEFGEHKGLGLIPGEVVSLASAPAAKGLKIPNIGWSALRFLRPHPLLRGISDGDFVYYVHSFYVPVGENTVARSDYGVPVTGIAACGSVAGCQFHPEKSGRVGLGILKAFIKEQE